MNFTKAVAGRITNLFTYKKLGIVSTIYRLIKESISFFDRKELLYALIFSSLTINVLALFFPMVLLQMYDRIIPNASYHSLTFLVLIVFTAFLFEAILKVARSVITTWVDCKRDSKQTLDAYKHILRSDISEYEKQGVGYHLEQLNSLTTLKDFYSGQILTTSIDIPFALIFLALFTYLSGMLVFVPIVTIFVFLLFAFYLNEKLSKVIEKQNDSNNKRLNFIIQMILGIHTIKTHAMEPLIVRRYERLQKTNSYWDYQSSLISATTSAKTFFFSQAMLVLVVSFGAVKVVNGSLSIGGLAACTLLSSRILQPIIQLVNTWKRLKSIEASEERIKDIYNLPSELDPAKPHFPDIKGEITMHGVDFSYDQKKVFNDLHLKIEPNEMVCISGPSMSGKSSLLLLLLSVLKPKNGNIEIDGKDIADFNVDSFRSQIGFVPQEADLFEGSLIDNLTMFETEKYQHKAKIISKRLGLEKVIKQMPKGYETIVGGTSVDTIPRGFIHRLSFVRALIKDPKILLIDEANSSNDFDSDRCLKEVFQTIKGTRTIIIISERPSIQQMADKHYEISNNELKLEKI